MKIRIGYGLGTSGMAGDGHDFARFIDDLERLKFDSVWFSERIGGNAPDPCSAMAFAAGRTTKLKLGMSVMVLPGRNPVLVAKELASIDMLSNGRLLPAFGLGAADPREHAGFGVERSARAPMFNEALTLIRRLWTEDHVTHHGDWYNVDDVTVKPKPVQSPPEVWLGGIAPSELRRVGRMAEGWLPSFITPDEAKIGKAEVERAAAEAGREIDREHFGALIVYSSGQALDGGFVDRIKARRPDVEISSLLPVGLDALRVLIERFIDAGFSKFVLLPSRAEADLTEELESVAASILSLEN
jgi:probable F420-dependent oxidoreductase